METELIDTTPLPGEWEELTKFTVPALYPGYFRRKRLLDRLNTAFNFKLTCIVALPGFGKSSLLADWMSSIEREANPVDPRHVAYVRLSDADNDPFQFWKDVSQAIARACKDSSVFSDALNADARDHFALVDEIINGLTDVANNGSLAIVLDHSSVIKQQVISYSLDFFVTHMPPRIHLVLAGANSPRLPIERYLLQCDAQKIAGEEMRFDSEEIRTFLEGRAGTSLDVTLLEEIERATGGWPLALQLLALSLDRGEDLRAIVSRMLKSDETIDAFLAKEILAGLPENQARFLLETAQLPLFCIDLCNRATNRVNARDVLDEFVSGGLCSIIEKNGRRWYAYNHLIAHYVNMRAYETDAEAMRSIALAASEWYEEEGMVGLAVRLSNQAGEWGRSAALLEENYHSLINKSRFKTLLQLIDGVPDKVIACNPTLLLAKAWALIGTDRVDEVDRLLKTTRFCGNETPEGPQRASLATEVAILGATSAAMRGKVNESRQLIDAVKPEKISDEPELVAWSYNAIGTAVARQADCYESLQILSICEEKALQASNVTVELVSGYFKGWQYIYLGKLGAAYAQFQHMAQTSSPEVRRSPFYGLPLLGLAFVEYERDEQEKAKKHLEDCIPRLAGNDCVEFLVEAYLLQARLELCEGAGESALEVAQRCIALANRRGNERVANLARFRYAALLIDANRVQEAYDVLENCRIASFVEDAPLFAEAHIALLKMLVVKNDSVSALKLVGSLLSMSNLEYREDMKLRFLCLQACALCASGEKEQACQALARALNIGYLERYVRSFLDCGSEVGVLFDLFISWSQTKDDDEVARLALYAGRLRALCGPSVKRDNPASALPGLTKREREIVRFLIRGYSNKDIANTLKLSESTVHTHRMNIYAKLDVHNRRELTSAAACLGIA